MLSYSSSAQVKAGLFISGFLILMCMVTSTWHHLTLPCYQVHAQKYRRARLPRPCRPLDARSVLFPVDKSQCTEPMAGTVLLGCVLHLRVTQRQSNLAKAGLERMPFLKGVDHALVRQDIGSSAEFEPSLSPDL